jgi:hypothetical protein
MKYFIIFIGIFVFCNSCLFAEPSVIMDLQNHYSGIVSWNESDGAVTFIKSGIINFDRDDEKSGIWFVPKEVKKIYINENVTVTGQFTLISDCSIEGENQENSIIFGTKEKAALHSKSLDFGGGCTPYSTIYANNKTTVYVKNLTVLNPLAFMFTGKNGAKLHLSYVRGIDNRGGFSNHSDGIQAGSGSTVNHCYFETGDDAVKVYNDILVENTTIKMIENCVPIQLGWGTYGNGAKGTFRNVQILGTIGRGTLPPVIQGRAGTYSKTIILENCIIRNTNAALVSLFEPGMTLSLIASNTEISVKIYWDKKLGVGDININGTVIP